MKVLYRISINLCKFVDRLVKDRNSQDFINWQDAINEISVK